MGECQVSGSPRLMSHELFTFAGFKAFDLLPAAPPHKHGRTASVQTRCCSAVCVCVCACACTHGESHLGVLEEGVLLDALDEHELVVAVPRPVQQVLHQVLVVLEDALW